MSNKVDLFPAFRWQCPECQNWNFCSPDNSGVSDEEYEDIFREYFDLEPWQELPENYENMLEAVAMPTEVVCICGSKFETEII
jgi:hypothetical protein